MIIDIRNVMVLYINTSDATEKAERIEKDLAAFGFNNVKRISFSRIDIPKLGCAISHNTILGTISELDKFPILVLEDDAQIDSILSSNPDDFIIDVPEDADAVYLGISNWGLYRQPNGDGALSGAQKVSAEKYNDRLHRLYNMLSAHAILYLNNEYTKFLHRATRFSVSINDNQDKARGQSMKFFNVYGLSKPIFYQSGPNESSTRFDLNTFANVLPKTSAW